MDKLLSPWGARWGAGALIAIFLISLLPNGWWLRSWLYDWQTLISAIVAGIAAVVLAVAARGAANRQVVATQEAAKREVDASNRQIDKTQEQIDATVRIEQDHKTQELSRVRAQMTVGATVLLKGVFVLQQRALSEKTSSFQENIWRTTLHLPKDYLLQVFDDIGLMPDAIRKNYVNVILVLEEINRINEGDYLVLTAVSERLYEVIETLIEAMVDDRQFIPKGAAEAGIIGSAGVLASR